MALVIWSLVMMAVSTCEECVFEQTRSVDRRAALLLQHGILGLLLSVNDLKRKLFLEVATLVILSHVT